MLPFNPYMPYKNAYTRILRSADFRNTDEEDKQRQKESLEKELKFLLEQYDALPLYYE